MITLSSIQEMCQREMGIQGEIQGERGRGKGRGRCGLTDQGRERTEKAKKNPNV